MIKARFILFNSVNPRRFFSELQRRNVYKVAVAYGVVAWLLIQIATQTFPFFEIPNWIVRAVILLLVLGFPIALVFAWIYELTPEGLRRTDEVPQDDSIAHKTGRRLLVLIAALVVLGLALLLFRFAQSTATVSPAQITSKEMPRAIPEKSIAVLPFVNLSTSQENAFFADGVHDEILTALARIADLKVISRASVMQFRDPGKRNLGDIAGQLGVAHVLEGSVQRTADRVRVSAQLIDARTDAHIWADHYDRALADVFGIQTEIAQKIVDQLKAALSPKEREALAQKPTYDPTRAYVLYLKARTYDSNRDRLFEEFKVAEQLYRESIQSDPSFALAYARLSATLARIYHWFDPTTERQAEIKRTAEKALELQPELGEGHYALGLYFYWTEGNYERALEQLRVAAAALPNESEISYVSAAIRRRQGKVDENLELLAKSENLDPRNANVVSEIAFTYAFVHDWQQAAQRYDRVVALAPDSANFRIARAYIDHYANGSLERLKSTLAGVPAEVDPSGLVTRARWDVAMLERDYAAADRLMAAYRLATFQSDGIAMPKSFFRGCTALARGDVAAARSELAAALPAFESAVKKAPTIGLRHANLGYIYSLLGRKEDAIREGRRAVELEPDSNDAVVGPWMRGFTAMIYARTGEVDAALPMLERLLGSPFPVDNTNCCITYNDLRKRWQWDPIRNDPRFQKLIASEANPASSPETR